MEDKLTKAARELIGFYNADLFNEVCRVYKRYVVIENFEIKKPYSIFVFMTLLKRLIDAMAEMEAYPILMFKFKFNDNRTETFNINFGYFQNINSLFNEKRYKLFNLLDEAQEVVLTVHLFRIEFEDLE